VFCAEIAHTVSQERLLVWLSGRRPRQCLVPVLIFGAIVGVIQGTLNIYLRPLAVMTMAVENLGSYGERFGPRPRPTPQWIATGRNLIQASVDPGPPLALRNLRIYRLDDAFALESIYRAKLAQPLDDHTWALIDGYRWDSALAATGTNVTPGQESRSGFGQSVAFSQTTIDLAAPPIWVSNLRIGSRYLERDTFSSLAKVQFSPDSDFRTWANARYSLSLFCAAMPLLAACLSTMLLANKVSLARLCFIAVAGYSANIVMKTFILLGEHGRLSPAFAGWTVPIALLLICMLAVRAEGKIEAIRSRLSKF
jgi:lipopolysaccharide export LptBFGC system permease protein LptF